MLIIIIVSVLNCIVLLIYCYIDLYFVDIIQYSAMLKLFVGVLDNPPYSGAADPYKNSLGRLDNSANALYFQKGFSSTLILFT